MNVSEKIRNLGLNVREFTNPEWPFTTTVLTDNLVFVSGHTPTIKGVAQFHGKVGETITIEQAKEASILCLENCLGSLRRELGDLDRIKRIVKVNGYIASSADFLDHVKVMAPVSESLNSIFGEKHSRVAIGVHTLPGDVPVEIEMIVEII